MALGVNKQSFMQSLYYLSKLRRNFLASVGITYAAFRIAKSRLSLPQQAQTIESISGHTYIRKRISLTFFVKKLILWSEGLLQCFLSDPTLFICRAVTFLNEINLPPHNSYYLRNTVKLIRRSSSIINKYIYPISPRDVKQKAPAERAI